MTGEIRKIKQFLGEQEEQALEFKAVLGRADGTVRAGAEKVYITLMNGQVMEIYNERVPRIPFRKIIFGYDARDPDLLQVLRFDDVYDSRPHPNLVNHKESHTWFGYDPVDVYREQILHLLPRAIGGLSIRIHGGDFLADNSLHTTATRDLDLSSEVPATGAEWVNVEIDKDGAISYSHGNSTASYKLLTPEDIPARTSGKHWLCSVRMYAGQTIISQSPQESDIFDPRFSGVGGGGLASAVDWDDVLDKPAVFAPDTEIADLRYVRYFLKSTSPTPTDDENSMPTGHQKTDLWLDQSTGTFYKCLSPTAGAAVWIIEGSGGGGGAVGWKIDGAIAVGDDVAPGIVFTADTQITVWFFRLRDLGESPGSSTFDIILNGASSIFQDMYDDFRPVIEWNDSDGWVKVISPLIIDFVEGDVITLNIDDANIGAGTLTVTSEGVSGVGGGSFNLTVEEEDGTPSVSNVGKIVVSNGTLESVGGGVVILKSPKYIYLRDEKSEGTEGGTSVANAWTKRTLNTEVSDEYELCSIASDQITLAPGTYRCKASAPFLASGAAKLRLRNITDSATALVGKSVYGALNAEGVTAVLSGQFTITTSKIFELQYIVETAQATFGLGASTDARASNSNEVEIYAEIEFWKVR
jgi:hypothetical protein